LSEIIVRRFNGMVEAFSIQTWTEDGIEYVTESTAREMWRDTRRGDN
jgi:hypothetical protein